MKTRLLLLLCWQAIGYAEPAPLPTPATGATVDESRVEVTLYVDPAHAEAADDDKHGMAADAPFATLRYACTAAAKAKDANKCVKLILANGTYREGAEIPAPKDGQDTDAPLVIEAAERDQAIIDGADTEGWTPSTWKAENGRWTHPWPFPRVDGKAGIWKSAGGKAGSPNTTLGPAGWGDFVVVNDVPLRQVLTEGGLVPGTFWIGPVPPPNKGSRVVALPPEGTELEGTIIQTGVRRSGLTINGRRRVTVRGVVFQHAANSANALLPNVAADSALLFPPSEPKRMAWLCVHGAAGLSLSTCADVLVEDVLCQWNDGGGVVVVGGTNVTLRRVRALHNGGTGIYVVPSTNVLAEDCESSFNNFRADWGETFFAGGTALRAEGEAMTWRRLHAVGNFGAAVSLTGAHLTLEDSMLTDNATNGLTATGAGPLLVRRCVITGVKAVAGDKSTGQESGIELLGAANVTLQSNVVAGNAGSQLVVGYTNAPASARSGPQTYRHNVFLGMDAGQFLCRVQEANTSKAATDLRTLDTDENCFWNSAADAVFTLFPPPGPSKPARGTPASRDLAGLTFDGWREKLAAHDNAAAEAHSIWKDPGFIAAEERDFRLKEGSPVTGWELPSEDASSSP